MFLCHGNMERVLSLLRVLAQLKTKVSLMGVSATIQSRFSLGLREDHFGGGPIAFGTFCVVPISYGIPSLSP